MCHLVFSFFFTRAFDITVRFHFDYCDNFCAMSCVRVKQAKQIGLVFVIVVVTTVISSPSSSSSSRTVVVVVVIIPLHLPDFAFILFLKLSQTEIQCSLDLCRRSYSVTS